MRGREVIVDANLGALYRVETPRLNEQALYDHQRADEGFGQCPAKRGNATVVRSDDRRDYFFCQISREASRPPSLISLTRARRTELSQRDSHHCTEPTSDHVWDDEPKPKTRICLVGTNNDLCRAIRNDD